MTVESAEIYSTMQSNPQNAIKRNIIDIKEIKTILYLGIKGNINLPPAENHTIDTFA